MSDVWSRCHTRSSCVSTCDQWQVCCLLRDHDLLQIIQYTQMVLKALPLMVISDSVVSQRPQSETLESLAAGAPSAHLQSLLDMKLQILLNDAQRSGRWLQSACVIQRYWRYKRFAAWVADDLQHRSLNNPMLAVLSDALHMHAIGKYYKVPRSALQ